jgi:hypothetical protein
VYPQQGSRRDLASGASWWATLARNEQRGNLRHWRTRPARHAASTTELASADRPAHRIEGLIWYAAVIGPRSVEEHPAGSLAENEPPDRPPGDALSRGPDNSRPYLALLVTGPNLWAIPFSKTKIIIETNATAGDAGIQVSVDAPGWTRLEVFDPNGQKIADVRASGSVGRQGLTELFAESAEPSFTEQSFPELFDRFPEGNYTFVGILACA